MLHGRLMSLTLWTAIALAVISTVPFTQPAQAQIYADPGTEDNNNCIQCHEDLYFLHDTGKWYCLRELPMTCTGCHGGDASAINQEAAHLNREAHPVMNEDVSRCQECHPEECYDRVELFDQTAGISQVLVAVPYTAHPQAEEPVLQTVPIPREREASPWINFWEILPIVLVAGAAILIYAVFRIRHRM